MKDRFSLISFGIRHRRQFHVPEIAGAIIDYIIHDKNSPFGENFFVRTDAILDPRGENKGRVLYNESRNTSIAIDVDSVVFNLEADDIDKALERLEKDYIPYIELLCSRFEIENFNRIGVVFQFDGEGGGDIIDSFVAKLTNDTFKVTQNCNIRFTSKEPDTQSLVMKELLDYKNHIVSVAKDENGYQMKFDYQFYFQPEIKKTNDIDFAGFLKEAHHTLDSKFLSWSNLHEEERKS